MPSVAILGGGFRRTTRYEGGGVSLAQLLFGNGEDGFLFGNWSELDELFTTYTGPIAVTSDSDPVGLALDDSRWGAQTRAQFVAGQPNIFTGDFTAVGVTGGSKTTGIADPVGGSGAIRVTSSSSDAFFSYSGTSVVGRTYESGVWLRSDSAVTLDIYNLSTGIAASRSVTLTTSWVFYEIPGADAAAVTFALQIGGGSTFTTGEVVDVYVPQIKLLTGNHALQATGTQRPLWRANSGKPYLSHDGGDDRLISPFIPTTACTLAIAVQFPATDASARIMIGGGASTGNKRCLLGKNGTNGTVAAGWGTETIGSLALGADLGTSDHVLLLTGDGVSRDVWVDGVLLDSRAPTGGPDGTGGGLALGAYNNAGSMSTFCAGRLYAALALNRRVTPTEAARITSDFQRTYQ